MPTFIADIGIYNLFNDNVHWITRLQKKKKTFIIPLVGTVCQISYSVVIILSWNLKLHHVGPVYIFDAIKYTVKECKVPCLSNIIDPISMVFFRFTPKLSIKLILQWCRINYKSQLPVDILRLITYFFGEKKCSLFYNKKTKLINYISIGKLIF